MGRLLLATYPLAMGLTLVIGGEHYVIDILAGWAIVAATTAVATRRGRHLPPSEQLPQQIPTAEDREHQPALQ